MELRTQITKLSLWIFVIPFSAINICLFISVNFHLLDNTFLSVDQIGRSQPTFPYFDGGVSISRTARTYPAFLIFKPAMIFTSYLLILYWGKTNNLINQYTNEKGKNNYFRIFGILSAIFLIIHSIFLGIKFDYDLYKFFRRFVLLGFIIFEIVAQYLLVSRLFKIKKEISEHINKYVLKLKIVLVSILILVALFSLPIVVTSGNVHFKHGLEWNYFVGVILFYLLTRFFWKKN
tara:strand:+ start:365 stop:1066 length:702 start_codon:yes stop_codon:yes gene_type:complete